MHRLIRGFLTGLLLTAATDAAAAEPVRVGLIGDGGEAGFRLGLDEATGGTDRIRGRRIVLSALAADDLSATDIVVAFGSSDAVRPLSALAEAAKRILLVADAGTVAPNRYVFQTAASTDAMAVATALMLTRPELNLLVAAEDTADGAATAAALKHVLSLHNDGGFFVGTRLVPPAATDVGALLSPEFDGLHDLHGGHTLLAIWSDLRAPIPAIAAAGPERFGIRLALAGPLDPNAPLPDAAFAGVTAYYPSFPHNRLNDRLVAAWRRRFHRSPDGADAAGMTAALALAAALKRAASTEALVAAFEGLRFDTPKGPMVIRQDHQTSQVLYQYSATPGKPVPALEHVYAISELSPDR